MIENLIQWITINWVEITGALLGVVYVFLSIKQNLLTWLMGLLTSILYIYVFYVAKFYADMALQFYYVWVSIYGWIIWSKGITTNQGRNALPIVRITKQQVVILSILSALLWIGIFFILKYFTDSPVPIGDSFITALSIVATWMLARKILEHWLIWIIVDFISILLYLYKELYPTTILFIVYTIVAAWGYIEWKNNWIKSERE